MDSIDRLVALLDLQTGIDLYCHLQAPFRMPHNADEPGTAWFHLLLEGRCTIEVNGKKHELQAGDFFLLTAAASTPSTRAKATAPSAATAKTACCNCATTPTANRCGCSAASTKVRNRAATALLAILPEPLRVPLR